MTFEHISTQNLEAALRALQPLLGPQESAEQDEDGFIEVLPARVGFVPATVTVKEVSILGRAESETQGWQSVVLRQVNSWNEPPDYEYMELGDPSPSFFGAVSVLASELAAEMVSNSLSAWAEDQAMKALDEMETAG